MKHPEWVGGKPPAAVRGCCGRAAALTALRRVDNAHDPSDSDGWRPPSLWAKRVRMLTRPGDAAALALRPKREKAAATRTGRWDHVRCARVQCGKVAVRPQQGGGHGFGRGGCGRQNTPVQARGIPKGWEASPQRRCVDVADALTPCLPCGGWRTHVFPATRTGSGHPHSGRKARGC